jgi:hypothetical protein
MTPTTASVYPLATLASASHGALLLEGARRVLAAISAPAILTLDDRDERDLRILRQRAWFLAPPG